MQNDSNTDPDAVAGESALKEAIAGLGRMVEELDSIVRKLESEDTGWDESVRLLEKANRAAADSSRRLEQVIQDVVYGASAAGAEEGARADD